MPGSEHLVCCTFPRCFTPLPDVPDQGKQRSVQRRGKRGGPCGQVNSGKPLCAPSPREAQRRNSSFWSASSRAGPGAGRRRELRGRASPGEGGGGRRARPAHLGRGASAPAPLPSAPWRMNGPGRKVRGSRAGQEVAGRPQGLRPAAGCPKPGHDGVGC